MASDFLAITERYLKDNSIINDNVDAKILSPIVLLVQDKYLHPILGSDLFDEISTQIKAGSVDVENQALLDDYILPMMLWYCLSESTPAFKYRYMNKGVMVKNSDNSSAADLSEIKFLMDKWEVNAKMYAERITRFLEANVVTYPLYCANPDCDDIKPVKTNYRTSIYLGDSSLTDEEENNIRIGNY